ncbi:hypothetical protein [Carnobacterium maltaromaticum]|uniref:hypothetical protein n=1 Tax=Carnobacterium maltaromaticum TaxID=2751 RepID=UPI0039BDCDD6
MTISWGWVTNVHRPVEYASRTVLTDAFTGEDASRYGRHAITESFGVGGIAMIAPAPKLLVLSEQVISECN